MKPPRVWLLVDGKKLPLVEPHPGADHARCEGKCPKCGVTPFAVAGSGSRPSEDDRAWEADAYCTSCKQPVGLIRLEPNTLFGVREDRAVLQGRCRVY